MHADRTIVADDLDEALHLILKQILDHGTPIKIGGKFSTASGRTTYEILNANIRVVHPQHRLPHNPELRFNIVAALARFLWMMSGNDRISDIAFYQPRAADFSDDGLTIPGSSYGKRILAPRPGLNQLAGVIDRLKEDPSSRRAFISIYHPEDAVRESKDIPCLLTLGFHLREQRLNTTVTFRANNAFSLFPYNFFELSLLAEVIARELDVELGPITHSAISMHIYEKELDRARAVVGAYSGGCKSAKVALPAEPLAGIRRLIEQEPLVPRMADADLNRTVQMLGMADKELSGVWKEMFQVLAIYVLRRFGKTGLADQLVETVAEPWHHYLAALKE